MSDCAKARGGKKAKPSEREGRQLEKVIWRRGPSARATRMRDRLSRAQKSRSTAVDLQHEQLSAEKRCASCRLGRRRVSRELAFPPPFGSPFNVLASRSTRTKTCLHRIRRVLEQDQV